MDRHVSAATVAGSVLFEPDTLIAGFLILIAVPSILAGLGCVHLGRSRGRITLS